MDVTKENVNEIKKCCLCKINTVLIQAHIIPKWAFKYLYPETDKDSLLLIKKGSTTRRPIGPYDPGILCLKCDNFLGIYDNYAKSILLDGEFIEETELTYTIKNVKHDKLRLFLISVVWRASISSLNEFSKITIGPYEDKIRNILLDIQNNVANIFLKDYSFLITKFNEGQLPQDMVNRNIQIPHKQKIEGVNVIVLYMPRGLKIIIKTDKRKLPETLNKLVEKNDNKHLLIFKLGNYSESREYETLVKLSKT